MTVYPVNLTNPMTMKEQFREFIPIAVPSILDHKVVALDIAT